MKQNAIGISWVGVVLFLILMIMSGCGGAAPDTMSTKSAGTEPKAGSDSKPAASEKGSPATNQIPQATSPEPINLSVFSGQVSGTELALWIALDQNLFQKYGINPKWNFLPYPTGVQALLSKDTHIGTAPGSAISAFASGSKELIFVAGNDDKPVYRIMTNNLTKPEEIRGKKIGVSSKYSAPSVAVMNYLEKQFNMKPDVDYKMVTFQTISDIVPALDKNLIDAGVLSTPLYLKAEKLGAKVLVDISKTFDEANAYIMTTRTIAKENPEGILRFLKAYAAGIEMARKNPDIAIASIVKHQTGITEAEAKITYDQYIKFLDVNMNPEAIKPFQIYTDNPRASTVNAIDMMDFSFLQQLDQSGFLKEHGFTLKVPEKK